MTSTPTTLTWEAHSGWLRFPDQKFSALEFAARVAVTGQQLADAGAHTVVLQADNLSSTLEVWLAGVRMGARVILLNPELPRPFFDRLLGAPGDTLFVGSPSWLSTRANRGEAQLSLSDLPRETTTIDRDRPVTWNMPGSTVMLTSGTTGGSKAVEWRWPATMHCARNMAMVGRFDRDDTVVTSLPLFHANALLVAVLSGISAGSNVYVEEKFSASRFSRLMNEAGGTKTSLLGSMASRILQSDSGDAEFDRMIIAPCDGPTAEALRDRYACTVAQIYGQTDVGICLWNDQVDRTSPHAGVPLPGWEAQLGAVDSAGVGELLVRNLEPGIAAEGYFGDPVLTLESRRDFWFHTGDLFSQDNKGILRYRGRTKDVVRVKGENVHAEEVERVITSISDVTAAAVVGAPADLGDEQIIAVIESDRSLAELLPTLNEALSRQLPRYAWPSAAAVVKSLPRTPTQKIAKGQIAIDPPAVEPINWASLATPPASTRSPA